MKIILDQCDEDTRVETALGQSYKDNVKAGELIKLFLRIRKVCNNTQDTDVFFGSHVTRITKHHFQPAIVKQLLAAHLNDDAFLI